MDVKNLLKNFSQDDAMVKENFQEAIKIFNNKIDGINLAPQKVLLSRLMSTLELKLSNNESKVWKRRNDAAHGHETESEDIFHKIKDIRILRILLNRILLKIMQISDTYIDYCSVEARLPPVKKLEESII